MATKKTKLNATQIKAIVEKYKQAWSVKLDETVEASGEIAKKAAQIEIANLIHRATVHETDPVFKAFVEKAIARHFGYTSNHEMYEGGLVSKSYMDALSAQLGRGSMRELKDKMCGDLKLALMLDPYADYTQVAATIETLNFNWKDMKDVTSET